MPSISDDYQIPIMYEDFRNPSMGMLTPFGMYNTNYLGGVRMKAGLEQDKVDLKNRRKKDFNAIKAAGIAIVSLASILLLKNKGVFSWISKQCTSGYSWVKNLFKSTKTTPPASTP